MSYRSNQPDIVCVSSADDNTLPNNGSVYQFQVNYSSPIIDPARMALVRASIPLTKVQIPNYCCCFWYYALATAGTARTTSNLRCVRFLSSMTVPPSAGGINYAVNRYISNYTDLVVLLNQASVADSSTYNPYFVNGDVTFALATNGKQITFQGTNGALFYSAAGYDDPNIMINARQVVQPGTPADITANSLITNVFEQNLNVRIGFSQPMKYYGLVPSFIPVVGGTAIPCDSYPNLVYTNTVKLYSSLAGASGYDSKGQRNFLALVPVNAPSLGVIQYECPQFAYLTKLPKNINNIDIQMLDDYNQPFALPDGAAVSLTLLFQYDT